MRKHMFRLSVVVNALLIILVAYLLSHLSQRSQIIQKLNLEKQVDNLVNDIRIPSEAILYDHNVLRRVCAIRMQSYVEHKTESYVPYGAILRSDIHSQGFYVSKVSPRPDVQEKLAALISGKYNARDEDERALILEWSDMQNESFENVWLNHTGNVLAQMNFDLEHNQFKLESFFQENPEVLDKRVRPHLERMLQAYHPGLRIKSATALLHLNRRSPAVDRVLLDFLKEPLKEVVDNDETVLRFSGDKMKAKELNRKYGLCLPEPFAEDDKTAKDGQPLAGGDGEPAPPP